MDLARDPKRLGFDASRLARIKPWMHRYVDGGRIPGASLLIARHGEIVSVDCAGFREPDAKAPWQRDTIVRLYSMTKPVTSLALLMLYEQALVHLDDPVDTFLPEFKAMRVLNPRAESLDDTSPAKTRPTIRHLLTHTSGLSYLLHPTLVGAQHAKEQLGLNFGSGGLERTIKRVADFPLEFEPGSRWLYSIATDVIGRVVEVVTGKALERYFREEIFTPLGMTETGFEVPDAEIGRFAALYSADGKGGMTLSEKPAEGKQRQGKVATHLGGSGLVGTLDDYWRFAEMQRAGGAFKGARLVSPKTLALAAANHLPGDIAAMGPATWAETSFEGVGYGLLGSVVLDPARAQAASSVGDYGWGGAAGTFFTVSPADDLVFVFLTQLAPSSALPLRKEMRALIHAALVS